MSALYLSSSCTWSILDMLRVDVGCHAPPRAEKEKTYMNPLDELGHLLTGCTSRKKSPGRLSGHLEWPLRLNEAHLVESMASPQTETVSSSTLREKSKLSLCPTE